MPAAQLVQKDAPVSLNVPASQVRHKEELLAPSALPKVPAGQPVHDDAPVALYEPAAQERQEDALKMLYFPAVHCKQSALPPAMAP